MGTADGAATFEVTVDTGDIDAFAKLSGDYNPLHTDADYAKQTSFGRQVLHGAFSAGLVSRMAGMFLPGRACLLHGLRLRFMAPIFPPAALKVSGRLVAGSAEAGTVDVAVTDRDTARQYVQASYDFGVHEMARPVASPAPTEKIRKDENGIFLVTGGTGALASALLNRLGDRGLSMSHSGAPGMVPSGDRAALMSALAGRPLAGIVHAGWPMPDNVRVLDQTDPVAAVEQQVAAPLRQILALGRLMVELGRPDASLILVGSTAASPGRHAYRMPLYSITKSMIPTLTQVLSLELTSKGQTCAAVVFDVLDGGINKALSSAQRQIQADRIPSGRLPTPDDAAVQILWMLQNRSFLMSGATITLSGGALP